MSGFAASETMNAMPFPGWGMRSAGIGYCSAVSECHGMIKKRNNKKMVKQVVQSALRAFQFID